MVRLPLLSLIGLGLLSLTAPPSLSAQAGIAEVNGVRLPYEIAGSGEPLVLIHGWAVDRGYWDGDVGRLAAHYRVIRYDRRGFGDATGKPDLTADAADLKALLEVLAIRRAHLLGHSQGTAVALTAAVRYPEIVDALILFGPGPPAGLQLPSGRDPPPVAEWIATGKANGLDAMKAAIIAWATAAFGDPPDQMPRGRTPLDKYTGLDLLDPDPPLHLAEPARIDEVGTVRAPTLMLIGEREMPTPQIVADVLTHGIPDARKVVIAGGGHVVNWTEPERFAAEVLRFLRRVEPR